MRKFEEDDGKLTTGFLGVRFLLPTLCDIGRSDIAYRLMTSTEYPGWGYSVVNGATTIWERWNSYTKEGGVMQGMNSFNHYSLGSCTEWMYTYCLGIRPSMEKPGCGKIDFVPCFDLGGKITSAQGHYDTDFGRVEVKWKKDGDAFTYSVTVPAAIEHTFTFDGMALQSETKNEDTYTFVLKTEQ